MKKMIIILLLSFLFPEKFIYSAGFKFIANDATLQGNIFSDTPDARTLDDIDHSTFHANVGGYAAYHRFNLGVVYHFNSGEIDAIKTHSYVSVNLDYKF